MAIDNTPPRLKLIVTIAVITVVTLVSLDFILKSYYGMMTSEAQLEKVAPTKDKDEQHKAEAVALTGATVPIDQAIASLAKGDRPDAITPNPSEDLAPMTGWAKLPKPAPTPMPHGADSAMPGDGGVMAAGDGGGAGTMVGDAGAMPMATDAGAGTMGGGRDGGARIRPLGGRPHVDGPVPQPTPPPPAP